MTDRARPRVALLVAVLAMLFLVACASGGGSTAANRRSCRAAPVDSMFLESGPVYGACEVDRPVAVIGRPSFAFPPGSGTTTRHTPACEFAEVEFVVDARGVARTDRIRNVRSNSLELLQTVRGAVTMLQFTPALKDGQPVAQLFRYGITRTIVRGVGSAPPARPSRPC